MEVCHRIAIEQSEEFFESLNEGEKKLESAYDLAYGDKAKRYAELSQKADLGLNTAEYEEFVSIGQEIAAQFPALVSGWDEQGKAVLRLKGNVEDVTAAIAKEYDQLARMDNLVNLKNFKETGFKGTYAALFGKKGLQHQKEHRPLNADRLP